jgi:hypothetical protein
MKKLILRCMGLAMMATLVSMSTGSGVSVAQAQENCACNNNTQTVYASGEAATCEDAKADLYLRLTTIVLCPDGTCYIEDIVITSRCYVTPDGRTVRIDGYRRFRCLICIEP